MACVAEDKGAAHVRKNTRAAVTKPSRGQENILYTFVRTDMSLEGRRQAAPQALGHLIYVYQGRYMDLHFCFGGPQARPHDRYFRLSHLHD